MPVSVQNHITTQLSPEILASIENIASSEGRQIGTVLNEALSKYIERKTKSQPRQSVLNAFNDSLTEFDTLYVELAK
jgi:hypothetical protein